jgi:glutamate N-acetyltransferase/amino-acid N-acetyltransferase
VLSELGASGAFLDQELVTISYGGHVVCEQGIEVAHDVDAVRAVMAARDIEIVADLGLGQGEAEMLFTDLSYAYIDENRGTS